MIGPDGEAIYAAWLEEKRELQKPILDQYELIAWLIRINSFFATSVINSLGGRLNGQDVKNITAPEKWKIPDPMQISDEEALKTRLKRPDRD